MTHDLLRRSSVATAAKGRPVSLACHQTRLLLRRSGAQRNESSSWYLRGGLGRQE